MAMNMGGSGRDGMSDINMTPMIDVLLVLLVIFMIAQPLLQKTIDVQVPKERPDAPTDPSQQIVLEIREGGVYLVNTQQVARDNLQERLTEIYTNRPDKILFVKAEPEIIYQDVISAMDAARGAGVEVLGAVME